MTLEFTILGLLVGIALILVAMLRRLTLMDAKLELKVDLLDVKERLSLARIEVYKEIEKLWLTFNSHTHGESRDRFKIEK